MENNIESCQDASSVFSGNLLELLDDKEKELETPTVLQRIVDEEPKNIDPLTEIPAPQMRLFGFSGIFKSAYFDTEEELLEYVRNNNVSLELVCVIEYLGTVAGCSDVIRLIDRNGNGVLYTAVDEDGYGIYNHERSVYRGEFVWEYYHGQIGAMYSAFRDRGISFTDDIYAQIDERNQKLLRMCKIESRKENK